MFPLVLEECLHPATEERKKNPHVRGGQLKCGLYLLESEFCKWRSTQNFFGLESTAPLSLGDKDVNRGAKMAVGVHRQGGPKPCLRGEGGHFGGRTFLPSLKRVGVCYTQKVEEMFQEAGLASKHLAVGMSYTSLGKHRMADEPGEEAESTS